MSVLLYTKTGGIYIEFFVAGPENTTRGFNTVLCKASYDKTIIDVTIVYSVSLMLAHSTCFIGIAIMWTVSTGFCPRRHVPYIKSKLITLHAPYFLPAGKSM